MVLIFSQRLKNWEGRERKKAREYDKETEREEEKKVEEVSLYLIMDCVANSTKYLLSNGNNGNYKHLKCTILHSLQKN